MTSLLHFRSTLNLSFPGLPLSLCPWLSSSIFIAPWTSLFHFLCTLDFSPPFPLYPSPLSSIFTVPLTFLFHFHCIPCLPSSIFTVLFSLRHIHCTLDFSLLFATTLGFHFLIPLMQLVVWTPRKSPAYGRIAWMSTVKRQVTRLPRHKRTQRAGLSRGDNLRNGKYTWLVMFSIIACAFGKLCMISIYIRWNCWKIYMRDIRYHRHKLIEFFMNISFLG